jgi:hypothetical protein
MRWLIATSVLLLCAWDGCYGPEARRFYLDREVFSDRGEMRLIAQRDATLRDLELVR